MSWERTVVPSTLFKKCIQTKVNKCKVTERRTRRKRLKKTIIIKNRMIKRRARTRVMAMSQKMRKPKIKMNQRFGFQRKRSKKPRRSRRPSKQSRR